MCSPLCLWCDCLVLGRPQSLQSRLREDPGHFGKQARAMPLYISGRGYEEISCLVPFKLLMIIGAQPDLDALLFPALHEEVKFPCQGQPTSWSPMYASCVAFIEKLYWGVAEPLPHELLVTGTKWVSKNLSPRVARYVCVWQSSASCDCPSTVIAGCKSKRG